MTEIDVEGIIKDERECIMRRGTWLAEHPTDIWYYERFDGKDPSPMLAFERTLEHSHVSLALRLRHTDVAVMPVVEEMRAEFLPLFRSIPWPVEKPADYESVMTVRRRWNERDRELGIVTEADPTVERADALEGE